LTRLTLSVIVFWGTILAPKSKVVFVDFIPVSAVEKLRPPLRLISMPLYKVAVLFRKIELLSSGFPPTLAVWPLKTRVSLSVLKGVAMIDAL
jgi:hypothetical protein